MTRTYSLKVDGKRVTMLALPGSTIEQVWASARARFGASRVTDVQLVEPTTHKPGQPAETYA